MSVDIDAPFDIQTPALLVDRDKLDANLERMRERVGAATGDSKHRPHLKTVKSAALARRITKALGTEAITVSTLKEAEIFADEGYSDILYAVGITSAKLDRVARLRARGVDLTVVTDNIAAARIVAGYCENHAIAIPVLIEIDSDGHRSGISPDDSAGLLHIAETLAPSAELRGVMTHAGGSYDAATPEELRACAEEEREAVLRAVRILRDAGYPAPMTSIGSTPTVLNTLDLTGISEVRAGVYVFFDLVMAGIGVCKPEDIALSVLTTVIGHQRDKGWIITDAGWMALSRDRGTAGQAVDQGYGLVCDARGTVLPDMIVSSANQEHGVISIRTGSEAQLPDLPVGSQLRILPNHACATTAQHSEYIVLDPAGKEVARWPRFSGW